MQLNTDAHASIAGYYKQVYVAIEQLTQLSNDEDSIGLECGSDVTCFFRDGSFNAREVKFYKSDFSKFSPEICKTIYNFYINGYKGESMFFCTNSGFKSESRYNSWDSNKKIAYIIECLLRHNVTVDATYKLASDNLKSMNNELKSNFYGLLTEKIMKGEVEASVHMHINPELEYKEFAEKINFEFEELDKVESINASKERSLLFLRLFIDNNMEIDIAEDALMPILHRLADEFFECCVKNSMRRSYQERGINYSEYNKITISKLKEIITDYSKYVDRYSEDILEKKIASFFDQIDEKELKSKYLKEKKLFEQYAKTHQKYNSNDLKKWLNARGEKFANANDLNEFLDRCELYFYGLGFIGMLVSEKLFIDVHENNLFLEEKNGRSFSIKNENLYNIQSIIKFIQDNLREKFDGVEIAFVKATTFTNFTFPTRPYVQIETSHSRGLTLEEYISSYNTPILPDKSSHLIELLENIIKDKCNLLVIGGGSTLKHRLHNALLSLTTHSDNIISYYENNRFKLSDDKQVQHMAIFDLVYVKKFTNLKNKITSAREYDYKFFNLDNYHYIENSVLDIVLEEFKNGKGYINSFKYSTGNNGYRNLEGLKTMFQAVKNKVLSFANVDIVIYVERCLESDVISHIFKINHKQNNLELLYEHDYIWT